MPFSLLADDKPYAPKLAKASDEGEKAIKRFQLPDGFQAELVAAEPMLANPVAFCIDEKGRFFVAETFRLHDGVSDNRHHMDWLVNDIACMTIEDRIEYHREKLGADFDQWATEHDRVRLVWDADGDGQADHDTVFSDGYNRLEDGLGSGVLAYRGNVYFTCIPDLWFLRDEDGDGKAEVKKSLQSGYGIRTSFIGHDLHGLVMGPDGKLYFSVGDRGMNVKTPTGAVVATECGSVVRCNLDGSDLELYHTGLRNPQELAFDAWGNLFTGDNNSDSGDRARLVPIVEGGDSGWRMPFQYVERPTPRGPWNEDKLWTPRHDAQPAYIVPPIINFGDGPSGLAFNPGIGLPEKFDNHFLLADFRGGPAISGIRHFRLEPDGASFKVADDGIFAWRIVATDVDFGYDGCIYALDWVEGWNKPAKGRIYRLYSPELQSAGQDVAQLVAGGIEKLPSDQLAPLLSHRDMRVRLRAQWALAERGKESIAIFSEIARRGPSLFARLHGIWGLGQLERRMPGVAEAILPLLTDPDPSIRGQAAKTLGEVRFVASKDSLTKLLGDENKRVQFLTATALGRLGDPSSAGPLLDLALRNADQDAYVRHAVVYAH
jgi:quinoprotein glucose dehydrogenase